MLLKENRGLLSPSVIGLLFLILFMAAFVAGGVAMLVSLIGIASPWDTYILLSTQTVLLFGLPPLVLKGFFDLGKMFQVPRFDNKMWKLLFWIIVAWGLSLIPVQSLWEINRSISFPESLASLEELLREMHRKNEQFLLDFIVNKPDGHLWLIVFVVAVLPAIFEELFFRGCLQSILVNRFERKWIAIALTATVFSIFHFEFFSLLPRIFLGGLLGYVYFVTRNIWYPITLHFVNNLTSIIILRVLKPQSFEELFAVPNVYLWVGLSLIAGALMTVVLQKIRIISSE